jgi:hypothetical protein
MPAQRASASRCARTVRRCPCGERQQRIEFVATEGVALGRALQLDEAEAVVHDHIHVGLAVRIFGVVEIEHRHAAEDADRDRRDLHRIGSTS